MSGISDRYPLIDYCGRRAVMDQHRDTPGTLRRNTDREQLHATVAELHNTMDRLRALQVDYRKLIESVHETLREAKALELRSKRGR